jgi:uncharacterized glyoxalase superfamily protein PhnB
MADSPVLERCVPTLRVSNARRSAEYFWERLGFQKDWEHQYEPGLPFFISVSRDGATLHLSEHDADGPGPVKVYIFVSDAAGLHEELMRRGAKVRAAPELRSYGMLEFLVEDLDGNVIRFGEAMAR